MNDVEENRIGVSPSPTHSLTQYQFFSYSGDIFSNTRIFNFLFDRFSSTARISQLISNISIALQRGNSLAILNEKFQNSASIVKEAAATAFSNFVLLIFLSIFRQNFNIPRIKFKQFNQLIHRKFSTKVSRKFRFFINLFNSPITKNHKLAINY